MGNSPSHLGVPVTIPAPRFFPRTAACELGFQIAAPAFPPFTGAAPRRGLLVPSPRRLFS